MKFINLINLFTELIIILEKIWNSFCSSMEPSAILFSRQNMQVGMYILCPILGGILYKALQLDLHTK